MTSEQFVLLALQLSAMLIAAFAFARLFELIRQPPVLGEMLAGVVLGPTLLGALFPGALDWLFPASGPVEIVRSGILKLGVLFFLFIIGLEIKLSDLRRYGRVALLIGLVGSSVPLVCGAGLVYLIPSLWPDLDPDHRRTYALFIGAVLAMSANPVIARILLDLKLLKHKIGTVILSSTVVDDLLAWGLFALLLSEHQARHGAHEGRNPALIVLLIGVFFITLLLLGKYVAQPFLHRTKMHTRWPAGFLAITTIIVLLTGAGGEILGIHAFLGAFVAGLAIAPADEEQEDVFRVINDFALAFFVPIYFVSMGLRANFAAEFDLPLVALLTIVGCVSKIASVSGAARMGGLPWHESLAVGCGMNARGAIGIILTSMGLEYGIIDQRVYVALVTMSLVTSFMAGPLVKMCMAARAGEGRLPGREPGQGVAT